MLAPLPIRKFRDALGSVVRSEFGDLTSRQLAVFLGIMTNDRTRSNKTLSDHLDLSPPVVSRAVTILEERGLVERQDDPADRRGIVLAGTRKGQEALSRLQARIALAQTVGAA